MPLTPQEQQELAQLEQEVGGLTPEEVAELEQLEAEFGGLTPEEHQELMQLETEFGAQPEQPSQLEAGLRGAAQGLTLEFADEATAFVESLFTDKTYEQARDEARAKYAAAQEAHPITYAVGQVGGGVATVWIPGMGWMNAGKGVAGVAKIGAATGAIYGAGMAEEIEDIPEEAVKSAALGAATGAIVGSSVKAFKKWAGKKPVDPHTASKAGMAIRNGEEVTEELLDWTDEFAKSETGRDVYARVQSKLEADTSSMPDIEEAIGNTDFVRAILGKQSIKAADRTRARQMLKGVDKKAQQGFWNMYKEETAYKEVTAELADEFRNAVGVEKLNGLRAALEDPAMIAKRLDDQHGFDLSGSLNDIHRAINKTNDELIEFTAKAKPIFKQITRRNKDDQLKFLQAIESGEKSDEINAVAELFEETRQWMNKYGGYNIPKRKNYFPSMQKRPEDMHEFLNQKIRSSFGKDEQLTEALEYLNTKGLPLKTKEDAQRLVNAVTKDKEIRAAGLTEASAIFKRTDKIPLYLREANPLKAYVRYTNALLNMKNTRIPISNMRNQVNVLSGMDGFDKSAKYWREYLEHVSGKTSASSDIWSDWRMAWKDSVNKLFDDADVGVKGIAREQINHALDLFDVASSSIYGNVMGMNPAPVVRNLSQTWALTAPELGGEYGYGVVGRAWKEMAKDKVKGIHFQKTLNKRNLSSDFQRFEAAAPDLADGIRSVPGTGHVIRGVEYMLAGDKPWQAMYMYTKSDTINRYIAMKAGDIVADDLLKNVTGAYKFLEKMTPAMRQQAVKALRSKDAEALKKLVATHLVTRTQFVYGREGLNQLGRQYGKMVSMFTKWPVNIAGEIDDIVRHKDWQRGMGKIMTPMILAASAHALANQADLYDDKTFTTLFGKSLWKWAPGTSPFVVGIPPIPQAAADISTEVSKVMSTGDVEQFGEKIKEIATPYIPGYGLYKSMERRGHVPE